LTGSPLRLPEDSTAFDCSREKQASLLSNAFLCISYIGDVAHFYAGARLLDDDYYKGKVWEVGLKALGACEGADLPLELRSLPLLKGAPIYLPDNPWSNFGSGKAIGKIDQIDISRTPGEIMGRPFNTGRGQFSPDPTFVGFATLARGLRSAARLT
jgi:hypothetical protein